MKKLNLILVMMLLFSGSVFSQWNTGGNTWNAYGATNWNLLGTNNIRSIGIGHKQMFGGFIPGWTNSNPPRAALHVNAHYLDNPPSWVFTLGQIFRTDGPLNRDNMWQMFTGNNYNNSTEKARLYVAAGSSHFSLQASEGDMICNTGGSIQRMRIMGNSGLVAIGQDFNNPVSLLHIDGTNDNTGEVFKTNTLNGLNTFWRMWRADKPIGNVFSRANGESIDRDNFSIQATAKDITFHTQPLDVNNDGIGEERMRIVGLEHDFAGVTVNPGNVGIGTQHPTQKIDVNGNARLRDLPNIHNENLTKCVVVDDDGVLHWRDFGGGGTTLRDNNQDFVGIGTKNPIAGLEVANGDIAVTTNASGIILKTNNGENYYRILVDDNGNLYTEKVDFN